MIDDKSENSMIGKQSVAIPSGHLTPIALRGVCLRHKWAIA
jgi:hypothetical protein